MLLSRASISNRSSSQLYAIRALTAMLLAATANAFVLGTSTAGPAPSRAAVHMSDDPTSNPFIQAINTLQETLQNSPVAEFKSKLAKLQAGNYDEAATKARLEAYIAESAVMFSFTT